MVDIPTGLRAIDGAWLTAALREAGHDAPAVISVAYEPMPGVVGAMGEIGILTLEYADTTDLPTHLVGKCPLDHEAARQFDAIMQYYRRETGFYRDMAESVPMRVPRPWVNLEDSDRHLLLIDYVDGAVCGDVLSGTDFAGIKRLVGDLAGLHGRFWMDPRLPELPWALDWRTPSFLAGIPLVQQTWPVVVAERADLFPPDLRRVCEATWVGDTQRWLGAFAARPWTFIHGDYELDNMLFVGDDVVVVDWQGCMRSFPGADLAWLLATSASEELVAREDELVEHYRLELLRAGGPAWSRDDVVEDMAWAMIYYVTGATIPSVQDYSQLGPQGERLHARFLAFLERCAAAAVRWDTAGRVGARL